MRLSIFIEMMRIYGQFHSFVCNKKFKRISTKLTTTYWFGNPPGPGLGQAQWCGGVKLVNRNLALSSDYWISNDNTEINEQSAPMYLTGSQNMKWFWNTCVGEICNQINLFTEKFRTILLLVLLHICLFIYVLLLEIQLSRGVG
jgi:hypothetical protein